MLHFGAFGITSGEEKEDIKSFDDLYSYRNKCSKSLFIIDPSYLDAYVQ